MTFPRPTAIRRAIYRAITVGINTTNCWGPGGTATTLSNMLGTAAPGYTWPIYYQTAPESAGFPFVVFSKSSGLDAGPMDVFGGTIHQNDIWMVKVIDHNTTADRAEASASRIYDLLTNYTSDTVSGGAIAYLRRESDFDYAEAVDGELYFHVGSNYRVITHFPGTALS